MSVEIPDHEREDGQHPILGLDLVEVMAYDIGEASSSACIAIRADYDHLDAFHILPIFVGPHCAETKEQALGALNDHNLRRTPTGSPVMTSFVGSDPISDIAAPDEGEIDFNLTEEPKE